MSTIVMNTSIAEASPRQQPRIAGALYVTNVVTSLIAFNGVGGPRFALGWLTFLSPSLAKSLSPYNYYPGGIGEILLSLWLLLMGINSERWKEQAQFVHKEGR